MRRALTRIITTTPATRGNTIPTTHAKPSTHAYRHITHSDRSPAIRAMSTAAAANTAATGGLSALPSVSAHSPRVLGVLGLNPGVMTLQGTNTYIIGTGAHRILIDTGEGIESYTQLLAGVLKEHGVTQLTILLSHWHADHTGGIRSVYELFDSNHAPLIYKYGGPSLLPARVVADFPALPSLVRDMADGAVFRVDGATLTAVHTPGHTTDHCIFRLEEESAILTGDTILGASTAVFEDLHAYMHSLRRIAESRPRRLYPAHGPIIDGDEAPQRVEQYIAHRTQRETQIMQAMKDIQADEKTQAEHKYPTAAELVERIYVGLAPTLSFAAANNVLLHLAKLQMECRVEPINDDAYRASATDTHQTDKNADEDDSKAEVAKAHAIALQRAGWRWRLTH